MLYTPVRKSGWNEGHTVHNCLFWLIHNSAVFGKCQTEVHQKNDDDDDEDEDDDDDDDDDI